MVQRQKVTFLAKMTFWYPCATDGRTEKRADRQGPYCGPLGRGHTVIQQNYNYTKIFLMPRNPQSFAADVYFPNVLFL